MTEPKTPCTTPSSEATKMNQTITRHARLMFRTCPTCDGAGTVDVSNHPSAWLNQTEDTWFCCSCDEEVHPYDKGFLVDGEIYCEDCGVDDTCETCAGEGCLEHKGITHQGKLHANLGDRSCGCCGARAGREGDRHDHMHGRRSQDWFVYRAGLLDPDGVYYSALCGDGNGENGCLESILSEQDEVDIESREKVAAIREFMGETEEDDGVVSMVRDMMGVC